MDWTPPPELPNNKMDNNLINVGMNYDPIPLCINKEWYYDYLGNIWLHAHKKVERNKCWIFTYFLYVNEINIIYFGMVLAKLSNNLTIEQFGLNPHVIISPNQNMTWTSYKVLNDFLDQGNNK